MSHITRHSHVSQCLLYINSVHRLYNITALDQLLLSSQLVHSTQQVSWSSSSSTYIGIASTIPTKTPLCPDCQIGKMPSRSFPSSEKRADKILEMVHCDLVEFPILSYYRHKYCLTIIDDYSGYGTICLLRLKSDTATAFSTWVTWAEKQTGHPLLRVRSDRGGEFMATIFKTFLTSKGVEQQLFVLDHPQQNGRCRDACISRCAYTDQCSPKLVRATQHSHPHPTRTRALQCAAWYTR